MRTTAEVVRRIRNSAHAGEFVDAFGATIFEDSDKAFKKALEASQAFQLEDPSFPPYNSKYDLRGSRMAG